MFAITCTRKSLVKYARRKEKWLIRNVNTIFNVAGERRVIGGGACKRPTYSQAQSLRAHRTHYMWRAWADVRLAA